MGLSCRAACCPQAAGCLSAWTNAAGSPLGLNHLLTQTHTHLLPTFTVNKHYPHHLGSCTSAALVGAGNALDLPYLMTVSEFAYLLKLACNLKISTHGTVAGSFADMRKEAKWFVSLARVDWGPMRWHSAIVSADTVNGCPFRDLLSAMCFTFLCFLLVVLLFKMPPSTVRKCCLVFISAGRL